MPNDLLNQKHYNIETGKFTPPKIERKIIINKDYIIFERTQGVTGSYQLVFFNKDTYRIEKFLDRGNLLHIYRQISYSAYGQPEHIKIFEGMTDSGIRYLDEYVDDFNGNTKLDVYQLSWNCWGDLLVYEDKDGNWWDKRVITRANPFNIDHILRSLLGIYKDILMQLEEYPSVYLAHGDKLDDLYPSLDESYYHINALLIRNIIAGEE